MPSVYSVSNCSPLDSSTVITPSLPTFSMTSAMRLPISESAAEMAATWAISSLPFTGVAMLDSRSTRAAEPRSIPCLSSMALAPAATLRIPSCTIDWARTVAVVVPSGDVVGLSGRLFEQLSAHVRKWVLELDLLGDGYAVVGHGRRAVLLVE